MIQFHMKICWFERKSIMKISNFIIHLTLSFFIVNSIYQAVWKDELFLNSKIRKEKAQEEFPIYLMNTNHCEVHKKSKFIFNDRFFTIVVSESQLFSAFFVLFLLADDDCDFGGGAKVEEKQFPWKFKSF